MQNYMAPCVTDYGDVAQITATLGDPFTGDQSFDVDGNVIEEGLNSINQCPTTEFELCEFNEGHQP